MDEITTYSGYDFDADDRDQSELEEAAGVKEKPGTFDDMWGNKQDFELDEERHCVAIDIDETGGTIKPAVQVTIYPPRIPVGQARDFVVATANELTAPPQLRHDS